jgi:hypothetical protein
MNSEPTTPRPSDLGRLLVLVLFVLCLRAFTVANTTAPSRDCIVFVRDGLYLEDPPDGKSRLEVIRSVEHPPGYPSAIILMSWLVRPLMGGTTTESMALSAQLVSAISALLLVFPLFFLTRRLFDRNTAFAAVAIFEVLPVFVEVTSDGISDGLFLLTAAWAIWFAVRALEQERTRAAFLFALGAGAFCGVGYIIRPDAAIVATAIGLTFFAGVMIRRLRRGGWRLPFVAGLGLMLGTTVAMSPYCIAIGGLSKKMTAQAILDVLLGNKPNPTYFRRDEARTPAVNLPIAAWWDPKENAGESKPLWAAKSLWAEYSKAAHYVMPWFGLIGLLAIRRRLFDRRIVLLLLVAIVHLAVLWLMAWQVDYVSQRHTLLTVMITSTFAAASFPIVGAWLSRKWPTEWMRKWTPWQIGAAIALLIMAVALPRDFRSLHRERAGHKAAGYWLRENAKSETIVDPFGWAEWYSGRTLKAWPELNPTADRELLIVFEPNAKSPHSRLERYEFAREMHKKSTLEFQYPENASPEEIKVAVYRYQPPPKKKK